MLFKKKKVRNEEADANYWISFTDLMTTLLIMVLLFSITQIVATDRRNQELEEAISEISVRTDIAKALTNEFENVDGLYVDELTGVITLSEEALLFEGGKSTLTNNSKMFLDWFFPRYSKVLMNEEYSMFVKSIEIEGHTAIYADLDHLGRVQLSLNRATSVYQYVYNNVSNSQDDFDQLLHKLTPVGRAGLDLRNPDNPEDPVNRRVEIHFAVDDVLIIEVVKGLNENR